MRQPQTGDRVQAMPFNGDGRFADDIDVFMPEDTPMKPIEGILYQEMIDAATGPRLESIVVTDDGKIRTVEGDRIVLVEGLSNPLDRIEKIREGQAPAVKSIQDRLLEIKKSSRAYPDLDRSPKENWVEKAGRPPVIH